MPTTFSCEVFRKSSRTSFAEPPRFLWWLPVKI